MPTLTYVMPNFNDSASIGDALESIFTQSHPPDEVIVVDDCSTDNSLAVLALLQQKYPRLRVIESEKNGGPAKATNIGVRATKTDYVCIGAANDLLLPGFFEAAMNVLRDHPQAGLACGDILLNDVSQGMEWEIRKGWLDKPGYISPSELAEKCRAGIAKNVEPYVFGPTCVFRHDLFMKSGCYPEDVTLLIDWFACEVVAYRHGICYVPMTLAKFVMGTGGWGSRITQPEYQNIVFKEMVHKFITQGYRDVLPFLRRGSGFNFFAYQHVNRPAILFNLAIEDGFDIEHLLLTLNFFYDKAVNWRIKATAAYATHPVRKLTEKIGVASRVVFHASRSALLNTLARSKNVFDRAYAGGYALYSRIRSGGKVSDTQ